MAIPDDAAARHAAIRIPLPRSTGVLGRLVSWYSRRAYGDVLDNALVLLHHGPALRATLLFEKRVARFHQLDPGLKQLAVIASAATIGCGWCMDFSYFLAHSQGMDLDKVSQVPHWRDSNRFTPLEQQVLEYTEAMTATPPTVTDAMVAALAAQLGVPAVVELTKMISIENERSRFNSALGLRSQGFSDRCRQPG